MSPLECRDGPTKPLKHNHPPCKPYRATPARWIVLVSVHRLPLSGWCPVRRKRTLFSPRECRNILPSYEEKVSWTGGNTEIIGHDRIFKMRVVQYEGDTGALLECRSWCRSCLGRLEPSPSHQVVRIAGIAQLDGVDQLRQAGNGDGQHEVWKSVTIEIGG